MAALKHETDVAWEKWGKDNPYFGVVSHDKFLNQNLDDAALQEFFGTGERHVEHIYDTIRSKIRPDFQPGAVLDYGCGVGRLVIPFARRAQKVVGVDVSPSMLEEARSNAKKYGFPAASLIHADDLPSLAAGSFDLIHSFIVFQHIPVARGEQILQQLLALLAEGGVGAIHVTFDYRAKTRLRGAVTSLRRRSGLVQGIVNLTQHKPFSQAPMQMNSYSVNRIFNMLFDAHCSNVNVEFSDHAGYRGALIFFEKKAEKLL
jgi:SAM-dependent methyltransferase